MLIAQKPGGGLTLRGLHPALQALIAVAIAVAALPDLTHRFPGAGIIAILYWEGLAWVCSALRAAWARLRVRSS